MRILFVVPKMYTRNELLSISGDIPEDFEAKSKEFWDYVAERLKRPRVINRIYIDSLTKYEGEDSIKLVTETDTGCGELVGGLVSEGAMLQTSEDPLLIEETASWASMLDGVTDGEAQTIIDLMSQNMSDRNRFLTKIIGETLKENETGVLFIRPGRDIAGYLQSDIKVIKIQPFEPSDYLDSWLVTLKLKPKSKKADNSVYP